MKLSVILYFRLYWSQSNVRYLKYKKMNYCRKIDGNKISKFLNFFDVISKFFRSFFDVIFLCFVFLYFAFSIFLLFLCFVLYFVIDPLSYRLHKTDNPTHFGWKKCLSSTPVKNEKIFIKCAQNRRCTSLMNEQSICKV